MPVSDNLLPLATATTGCSSSSIHSTLPPVPAGHHDRRRAPPPGATALDLEIVEKEDTTHSHSSWRIKQKPPTEWSSCFTGKKERRKQRDCAIAVLVALGAVGGCGGEQQLQTSRKVEKGRSGRSGTGVRLGGASPLVVPVGRTGHITHITHVTHRPHLRTVPLGLIAAYDSPARPNTHINIYIYMYMPTLSFFFFFLFSFAPPSRVTPIP
jgi:hypothetical protein